MFRSFLEHLEVELHKTSDNIFRKGPKINIKQFLEHWDQLMLKIAIGQPLNLF